MSNLIFHRFAFTRRYSGRRRGCSIKITSRTYTGIWRKKISGKTFIFYSDLQKGNLFRNACVKLAYNAIFNQDFTSRKSNLFKISAYFIEVKILGCQVFAFHFGCFQFSLCASVRARACVRACGCQVWIMQRHMKRAQMAKVSRVFLMHMCKQPVPCCRY